MGRPHRIAVALLLVGCSGQAPAWERGGARAEVEGTRVAYSLEDGAFRYVVFPLPTGTPEAFSVRTDRHLIEIRGARFDLRDGSGFYLPNGDADRVEQVPLENALGERSLEEALTDLIRDVEHSLGLVPAREIRWDDSRLLRLPYTDFELPDPRGDRDWLPPIWRYKR